MKKKKSGKLNVDLSRMSNKNDEKIFSGRENDLHAYTIPPGTQQETGIDRFLKKTAKTDMVKDARINNKADAKNKGEAQ